VGFPFCFIFIFYHFLWLSAKIIIAALLWDGTAIADRSFVTFVLLFSDAQNHSGVHDPRDDPSAPPRPFLFNFFIDSVPFEACTQTESDLAGGNISIDTEAQAVAQAQAPASSASASSSSRRSSRGGSVAASSPPPLVQSGRRYSVHKPLTAAEYEAALHEANERERLEEEAAKEARRAAKEKEELHHHHHHRKLSSESQSRA